MRTERAFTLIELLVVLSILAMLIAMGGFAYTRFMGAGPEADTKARLVGLGTLLEGYRNTSGDYPSSSLAASGVRATKSTYEGIEALTLAFFAKSYGGNRPSEAWLMNLDDDVADKSLTIFPKLDLFEVVDAWNNPIVYIRYDAYDVAQEYEFTGEDQEVRRVQVKGAKNSMTGGFHDSEKYQLLSVGKDGLYGTEDDVTSYSR